MGLTVSEKMQNESYCWPHNKCWAQCRSLAGGWEPVKLVVAVDGLDSFVSIKYSKCEPKRLEIVLSYWLLTARANYL